MIPAQGYAFIVEDKKKSVKEGSVLEKMGFDAGEVNMGVIGTIYAVKNTTGGIFYELWKHLFSSEVQQRFKKGQRVIYSRYVTEDTYVEDEEGKEIKGMHVVPLHAILAIL